MRERKRKVDKRGWGENTQRVFVFKIRDMVIDEYAW